MSHITPYNLFRSYTEWTLDQLLQRCYEVGVRIPTRPTVEQLADLLEAHDASILYTPFEV